VTEEDETFLLKMMERSDIAVVSEGLFYGSDTSVWDLDFIAARSGDKMFHRFRVFEKRLMHQENFDSMRLGIRPKPVPNVAHEQHFKHYSEMDGDTAMKIEDYVRYLHTYNSVQDQKSNDSSFSCLNSKGDEMHFDVSSQSLYMIDLDLRKLLPETFEDFSRSFRLPSLLPGGKHCLMNAVRACP